MKILVFNEKEIQDFRTSEKHILISIKSPNASGVHLPNQKSRIAELFLVFEDIDFPSVKKTDCNVCEGTGYLPQWKHIENGRCFQCNPTGKHSVIFKYAHAKLILEFVEGFRKRVEYVIVNCEAGISRSAGVAGALSKIYNGDDSHFFIHYLPNMFVYRRLLEWHYDKENIQKRMIENNENPSL